jgi:hypothetical protein
MGTVLAVIFAALVTTSLCPLRTRWAARDIPVPTGVFLLAINIAVLVTAVAGWWFNPWVGAAAGVLAGVSTVTGYTDILLHLGPSGAIWVGVCAGLVLLIGGVVSGGLSTEALGGALWLSVVAAVMAVFAMTAGGFGGGDVRFLLLMAATLWWVSLPTVLSGFLIAYFVGFFHALRDKSGAPLVPYLTGGLVVAVLVTALFFK